MARVKQQARRLPSCKRKGPHIIIGLEEENSTNTRSKRQASAAATPSSPAAAGSSRGQTSDDDERFRSSLYRELYFKTFTKRKICEGRHVDFDSLDEVHAGFIRKWFKFQGWDKLLTKNHPIYPDLVRQFYTHFDHANKKDGIIYTWVKGKEIKLDEATLSSILKIPRLGVHAKLPGKKWSTLKEFDVEKCLNLVLMEDESGRDKKPEVYELPLRTRLLHLILFKSFNMHNGRPSSLTYLDMLVMYFFLAAVKMNMPRMMIDYMIAVQKGTKEGLFLPYGMWLTKVFERFGVDLSDEVMEIEPKQSFNKGIIHNALGYKYDDEQRWVDKEVKRAPVRKRQPEEEEDDKDDYEEDGQGNRYASSFEVVMRESMVVQEMLKRMRPDIFTNAVMREVQESAQSRIDTLNEDSDAEEDEGNSYRRAEKASGAPTDEDDDSGNDLFDDN